MNNWRITQAGDTLVEVTLSLAILSAILVTAFSVANLAFRTNQLANQRAQAINLLQEQVEALHWYRDYNVSQGLPAFSGLPTVPFYMMVGGPGWTFATPSTTVNGDGRPGSPGQFTLSINPNLSGQIDTFKLTATWNKNTPVPGPVNIASLVTNLVDTSSYTPVDCGDETIAACQ